MPPTKTVFLDLVPSSMVNAVRAQAGLDKEGRDVRAINGQNSHVERGDHFRIW